MLDLSKDEYQNIISLFQSTNENKLLAYQLIKDCILDSDDIICFCGSRILRFTDAKIVAERLGSGGFSEYIYNIEYEKMLDWHTSELLELAFFDEHVYNYSILVLNGVFSMHKLIYNVASVNNKLATLMMGAIKCKT